MKIIEGKNPKVILLFDYFTGEATTKIYSEKQASQMEIDIDLALQFLFLDYPFMKVALEDFDKDDLSIVVMLPSEISYKKPKTKINELKNKELDLYSYLIQFDPENTIIIPFGKNLLSAYWGIKDILKQAGKERNLILDLKPFIPDEDLKKFKKKDLVKKYKTIPVYSLPYLIYNPAVINNLYFIFRKVYNTVYQVEEKEISTKILLPKEAIEYLQKLISSDVEYIFFDIETESVELSDVLGVSIDYEGNEISVYIPISGYEIDDWVSQNPQERLEIIKKIKSLIRLLLKTKPIIGHHLKFDIKQLIYNGIIKRNEYKIKSDTFIMANLVYNKILGGLSLKHLAKTLIGVFEDWDKPLNDYKRKYKITSYKEIPLHILGKYASLDAYYTKQVYNKLKSKWKSEYDYLLSQYLEIQDMVMYWELDGVGIDIEKLNQLEELIRPLIDEGLDKIKSLPTVIQYEVKKNKPFNVNSTQQLSEIIQMLGIKAKKTKLGYYSLSKDILPELLEKYEELYKQFPENKSIEEKYKFLKYFHTYKTFTKFMTTYIKPFKEKTDSSRILRIDYNIGGAKSGRLSSFFHTLPSKGDIGRNFKMLITSANKNNIIVYFDIQQLEPRVLASISKEQKLIQSYLEGKDLYKYMASKVFKIPYEEVSKEQRNKMKVLTLAILYGMSAPSLAKSLGITKEEAEKIMENFDEEFDTAAAWRQEQFIKVKSQRKVITPLGREIPLTDETDEEIKKISVNYIIQSTASEVALITFKEIDKYIRENYTARTVGSVHDSLIIETPVEYLFDIIKYLKDYTEREILNIFDFLEVPLRIDLGFGISWGNSLEVDEITFKDDAVNLIATGIDVDYISTIKKLTPYFDIKLVSINKESVDFNELSLYNYLNANSKITVNLEIKKK